MVRFECTASMRRNDDLAMVLGVWPLEVHWY